LRHLLPRSVRLRRYNSSADLPRSAATSSLFFSRFKASNVALITLCGLVVPIDLVSTFCTPADVITARTAPPAITPVPSGAGLSKTIPEPNRPITVCGIEVCVRFTRTRFFFADSIPLRIAWGTSFAFPEPYPTTAALGSPTTTKAAKERFLPPLTTLVTRLIATTSSLSWYEPASSFFVTIGILTLVSFKSAELRSTRTAEGGCPYVNLELQSRLARCISQSLHAPVINVAATVEYNFRDSLRLGAFSDVLSNRLGSRDVPSNAALALAALGRICRNQCLAVQIVNHLNVNVVQRTVHIKLRPLGRPQNILANTLMHMPPVRVFR